MSKPSDSPSKLPLVSTFSFTAPFVVASSPSASTSEILPLKQRRVSLALPSSPRLVAAWNFRDDTGLGSHIAETSGLMPEKKGKMRKIANACQRDEVDLVLSQEKKQRKKWTMEETRMLVDGCNIVSVSAALTLLLLRQSTARRGQLESHSQ
jgi:hypothetical protein